MVTIRFDFHIRDKTIHKILRQSGPDKYEKLGLLKYLYTYERSCKGLGWSHTRGIKGYQRHCLVAFKSPNIV